MTTVNPVTLTSTEVEHEPTNVVSRDCTAIVLVPLEATQATPGTGLGASAGKPGLFSPDARGHSLRLALGPDANTTHLLPVILPLLQALIWEVWADTFELISFDSGRCEETPLPFDQSLGQAGINWLDRVCPLDLPEVKAFFALDEADLAHCSIDYRVILATGELLWVRHWLLRRLVGDDGRARLSGLIMPITEQKRLERECLLAGEHERERIGQELHDDVCQELAGLGCMMEVLAGRLAKKAPELHREFHELKAAVTAAMNRTRSMAHGLFPAQLNYASLEDALRVLTRQTETRFGLAVLLDLPRRMPHHSPDQVIHLYRIVQEAVSNSIRHGGATEVRIKVKISAKCAEVRVEDNGTGFPASTSRPNGVGLHSMEYRTRILGGSLDFGNRQSTGAIVRLKYPLVAGRLARLVTGASN